MDIHTLQRQAWDVAETKGHHATFAQSPSRLHALAHLAPVFAAITALAQDIKRDDMKWRFHIAEAIGNIIKELDCWRDEIRTPHSIDTGEESLARLTLIHTEVSEAAEAVSSESPQRRIMEELADILIRVGDLAETIGGDLEEAVRIKIAQNAERPYAYGTPWAQEGDVHDV